MNKFLAIFAFVAVACVVGVSAMIRRPDNEFSGWHCGVAGGEASFARHDVAPVWSNSNDKVCKKTCSGTYPIYKKGNWGLFSEGLQCCCGALRLFGSTSYHESSPYISSDARTKFGVGSSKPRD